MSCPECRYGGGYHPAGCPNAPEEPEHDEECAGQYCKGYVTDAASYQQGEDGTKDCPCFCHQGSDYE